MPWYNKGMKRTLILLGYAIILYLLCSAVMAEPAAPHAILLNGNAMAPVRPLAAGVQAAVSRDAATGAVTLTRGDVTLMITPYDRQARLGDQLLALPAPSLLRAGQLFVPVRAITDAFAATAVLHGGMTQDSAKQVAVTYQHVTTVFRAVEAGRMLIADVTGDGQAETAFAVANVPGIDAYNSRYLSDIVPLEVWVVEGTRERWRTTLAKGVSISRFEAPDLTGDRTSELLLTYFTRHSYMGPYPGSIYTVNAFGWNGRAFTRILALDYSRDHGHLYTEPATLGKAAAFILTDTNWKRNEDSSHYIAELYAWNGRQFALSARKVTGKPIPSETVARRLLGLIG